MASELNVEVSVKFLKQVLYEMESAWHRIDGEWGPTPGGLAKAIRDGHEPEIAELSRIIKEATKKT